MVEAFQAAMGDRLAIWSRALEEQGWQGQADKLRLGVSDGSPDSSAGQVPPAFRRPQPAPNPRSMDAVAEEVIRTFDKVEEIAASKQRTGTGTGADRSGKLILTLSASALVSCVVDVPWASKQTATMLMNALGEALAAARADLARHVGDAGDSPNLNGLFAEALALLNDPQRVVDS